MSGFMFPTPRWSWWRLQRDGKLSGAVAMPRRGGGEAMTSVQSRGVNQRGRPAALPASAAEAKLEIVPNPHPGMLYAVRFTCPEFTALCPLTGQPDFAHLVIDYVPQASI